MNTQIVLIDCDGVLVDNVAFDTAVSRTIVEFLAEVRGVTVPAAQSVWDNELASSSHLWQWYDYKFHCARLGLPTHLVEDAHRHSRHLLSPISDSRATLGYLADRSVEVHVVTDATDWVARFKLSCVGLESLVTKVHTSDTYSATKKMVKYWTGIQKSIAKDSVVAYIDNRSDNFVKARAVWPRICTILYDNAEHVHSLSAGVTPIKSADDQTSLVKADLRRSTVGSHEQMRTMLPAAIGHERTA